jgi:hypothetical protein
MKAIETLGAGWTYIYKDESGKELINGKFGRHSMFNYLFSKGYREIINYNGESHKLTGQANNYISGPDCKGY